MIDVQYHTTIRMSSNYAVLFSDGSSLRCFFSVYVFFFHHQQRIVKYLQHITNHIPVIAKYVEPFVSSMNLWFLVRDICHIVSNGIVY